jgi:hypothetical protein
MTALDDGARSALAKYGCVDEAAVPAVACAMSGIPAGVVDAFLRETAEEQSFRSLMTRWPMLGHVLWSSPEFVTQEVDIGLAHAILTRAGATCANDRRWQGHQFLLEPLEPHVLKWLNGRTWNCEADQSIVLPIALNFLNLAGPASLPSTRDQWIELLAPLAEASSFLHQLGERPVRLLGVAGVRNLLAVIEAVAKRRRRHPDWRWINVDDELSSMINEAVFDEEDEDEAEVNRNMDPIVRAVLLAEAIRTFPAPGPD